MMTPGSTALGGGYSRVSRATVTPRASGKSDASGRLRRGIREPDGHHLEEWGSQPSQFKDAGECPPRPGTLSLPPPGCRNRSVARCGGGSLVAQVKDHQTDDEGVVETRVLDAPLRRRSLAEPGIRGNPAPPGGGSPASIFPCYSPGTMARSALLYQGNGLRSHHLPVPARPQRRRRSWRPGSRFLP